MGAPAWAPLRDVARLLGSVARLAQKESGSDPNKGAFTTLVTRLVSRRHLLFSNTDPIFDLNPDLRQIYS